MSPHPRLHQMAAAHQSLGAGFSRRAILPEAPCVLHQRCHFCRPIALLANHLHQETLQLAAACLDAAPCFCSRNPRPAAQLERAQKLASRLLQVHKASTLFLKKRVEALCNIFTARSSRRPLRPEGSHFRESWAQCRRRHHRSGPFNASMSTRTSVLFLMGSRKCDRDRFANSCTTRGGGSGGSCRSNGFLGLVGG